MRHNSGFSILLKDTSGCRFFWEDWGSNCRLEDDHSTPLATASRAECGSKWCAGWHHKNCPVSELPELIWNNVLFFVFPNELSYRLKDPSLEERSKSCVHLYFINLFLFIKCLNLCLFSSYKMVLIVDDIKCNQGPVLVLCPIEDFWHFWPPCSGVISVS